jgi:MFS transporter, FSR family, fosmidomycin resistance protein
MMVAMAAVSASAAAVPDLDRRGISLLSFSHVVNDMNQSALPAIIPWLVAHRGLSLATAATLVLAMNLSSSIVQPLFGHLSDRRSLAWVIPAAVLLACAGMAVVGFSENMPMMLLGALISGIGVAAFHPEGSRFANYFSGANRATAMSWFTTGGYVGFALGPLIVTPLILAFGLPGVAFLLVPGVLCALLLWRELPRFQEVRMRVHRARRARVGNDDWRGFSMLTLVVALRSMTFLAAVTFMPVFAIDVMHVDRALGSVALAAMLIGGVFGTMWGGRLADRFDRRRVVSASLLLTGIVGAAIALAGLYAPHFALLLPLAVAFGFVLGISASVVVVIGQEYLPKRIGVASGVTLGLAVTIGGLAAPLFGLLGDHYGLVTVFEVISAFAIVSLAASFLMPKPHHLRVTQPEVVKVPA